MKHQNHKDKVIKILEEAPNARKALLENYTNLLQVSEYCQENYLKAGNDSTQALEATKKFTTQSLASVTYQISSLASSVLSLLDAQTNQLRHVEASINVIAQTVEMHKEKVSRREIGVFTTVRRVPRSHKIISPQPANAQARPPYSRRPISYQQLDGLGHGVKVSGKQSDRTGTIRKHGASVRSNKPPEPVQCPVPPPVSGSSFGKNVAPPTIPSSWQAASECDIITALLEDAPPPQASEAQAQNDEVMTDSLPPPDVSAEMVAPQPLPPPPPPPPPPLPPLSDPPLKVVTNAPAPSLPPPVSLETVVEENSLPPPPPPPPSDDDLLPCLANDSSDLPAPPPPPPTIQEVDVTLPPQRSRRHRSPPASRSLSLRVRSGPASRARYTRSVFLPAVQSYLEIPAPPPPPLVDHDAGFEDMIPPLPPPVDYDTAAPPDYLEKVVALYSYEATKPDDLSITEGDIIYLTRRHDDGWCQGVLNGIRGFFPENYVESCS
ncbi:ABI family, member 3a isoform X2 [Betta splendens]|uniref:ABI gene family member 3 n=1 Tax=Betta splendens TaxID=158456 RepID=A0A6P7N2R4_BETSP|nr:ABI family, member 3a isoform X2 [Betta splendens]